MIQRPVLLKTTGALLLSATMLHGCGGSGGDSGSTRLAGTAVVPKSLASSSTRPGSVDGAGPSLKSAACPNVPDGYDPAASAPVEILRGDGAVASTTTTDACGRFSANASDGTTVRISPAGFQPVVLGGGKEQADVLVSALPSGAKLEVLSLQYLGQRQLSVLVVDSVAKKAVLGLQPSAYEVKVDGNPATLAGVSAQSVVLDSQPFSTVLVLDSSSSMSSCAANCAGKPGYDSTQPAVSRYRLTARAAHQFLDGKKPTDEVALTFFSSTVYPITDASFANRFKTADNAITGYTFSADGFTTDSAKLRLPVDHYNRESALWSTALSAAALHPATTATGLKVNGSYPYSGSTAMFSATTDALKRLENRPIARKIVITLTDGENNSGSATLATTTAAAKAAGVPVYTVGVGLDSSSTSKAATDLRSLATNTGADFAFVDGTDLVGLYAGLQTAIRFETTLTIGQELAIGQEVAVSILQAGTEAASRSVTINR